jgi:hypothetical protein
VKKIFEICCCRIPDLPDDEEMKKRANRWLDIFTHYENCDDTEEDGLDMDDLVAIAEAEDQINGIVYDSDEEEECDEENINSDEEAIEDNTETVSGTELELVKNKGLSREETLRLLLDVLPPGFVESVHKVWHKREEEISRLNLPFWNT